MHVRAIALVGAACAMILPYSLAGAAGYWNVDQGASNMAKGGANIVQPMEPTAVYTNPSALPRLSGLQMFLEADAIFDGRTFERAPYRAETYTERFDAVENGQQPMPPSPSFFASYNMAKFDLPQLSFGAGVYGPPRSDTVFSDDGPQRYSVIEMRNLEIHYTLAAAYAFDFWDLSIGVSGFLISQIIDTKLALNAFGNEEPGNDAVVDVYASEHLIPGGVFSISAWPVDWLGIALVYQPSFNVDASGEIDVQLGENLASSADVAGNQLDLRLKMPAMARASVKMLNPWWRRASMEFAVVWEQWSRNQAIEFEPQDIEFTTLGEQSTLDAIRIENNWQDTWSFRLGFEVEVLPEFLWARAGGFFEQGAVPDAYLNVASFDLDKFGVSAGGRINLYDGADDALFEQLWVDGAVAVVSWMETTVSEAQSEIRLVDVLATGEDAQNSRIVGAGTYSNTQLSFILGVGGRFGL